MYSVPYGLGTHSDVAMAHQLLSELYSAGDSGSQCHQDNKSDPVACCASSLSRPHPRFITSGCCNIISRPNNDWVAHCKASCHFSDRNSLMEPCKRPRFFDDIQIVSWRPC